MEEAKRIFYELPVTLDERQLAFFNKNKTWVCKNPKCVRSSKKDQPFILAKVRLNPPSLTTVENDPSSTLARGEPVMGQPHIEVQMMTREGSDLIVNASYVEIVCKNNIHGNACGTKNVLRILLMTANSKEEMLPARHISADLLDKHFR